MMDLFDEGPADARNAPHTPLAARMRPRTLEEFVGQEQIIGPDSLLRRAIEEDALTSFMVLQVSAKVRWPELLPAPPRPTSKVFPR
jgi:hypothetical protein